MAEWGDGELFWGLLLILPAIVLAPVAWIVGLTLTIQFHHWAWLSVMVLPLIPAIILIVTGAPLAANADADYMLGNTLLIIGWGLVVITLLTSLVYSVWRHPKPRLTTP